MHNSLVSGLTFDFGLFWFIGFLNFQNGLGCGFNILVGTLQIQVGFTDLIGLSKNVLIFSN